MVHVQRHPDGWFHHCRGQRRTGAWDFAFGHFWRSVVGIVKLFGIASSEVTRHRPGFLALSLRESDGGLLHRSIWPLGVKKLTGELIYCDIGCFLVLASFFAMVFVEAGHESKDDSDSEGSSDESALSAEWDARARSMDPMAAECDVRFMATGGFSVFGVPEGDHPLGKKHGQIDLSRHEHITSLDRLGPGAQRLLGVILAILAGGLCGVQGVPATLWEASHPEAEAFAVALWNLDPLFQCGRDSRGEVEEVRHRPRLCQRLHLGRGLRLYDEGHFFPGLFRGVHLGRCRTHPCVKPPFCLCVQRDHGQEAVADLLRRLLLATRGRFAHCMLW
ncbi:unnamed protein product [Cladocopium goreaui]|uniref:Transmembrane protein 144-like B n=1 Tax=Cladocopium goreaui TaxID=2562237 RepID=A0A9P1D7K5_9DINO|nr:unnamed protein product [Cladocopium goreaui]